MKGYCRVCPVCDGRACAGQVPGMGGIGTGSAFTANVAALASVRFNMRVIHADAVMIGRPFSVAAVGGLKQGVTQYLEQLRSELIQAMILTGCPDVSKVDRGILS